MSGDDRPRRASGKQRRPESISGMYAPLPFAVLDGAAYQGSSFPARGLLVEVVRQHSGSNNGHMQLTMAWLVRRGWTSCDVVQRAKAELIDRGLIIETRKGGLNNGPSLFALTWLERSSELYCRATSDRIAMNLF